MHEAKLHIFPVRQFPDYNAIISNRFTISRQFKPLRSAIMKNDKVTYVEEKLYCKYMYLYKEFPLFARN